MTARYEERACGCWRGHVYESGVPTGRWVPCGDCKGVGRKIVFVYAKKRRRY